MRRTPWLLFLLLLPALVGPAAAERLPIRTFSTSDGLPRNIITRIVRDPRGFLWICTNEGLSRFDGDSFTTYGTAQGLPDDDIADLLITRAGEYWLATRKGLVLFRPDASKHRQPRFTRYAPGAAEAEQRIITVAEDASGTLWCSTFDAVYRVARRGPEVAFERLDVVLPRGTPTIVTFMPDRAGAIWIATKTGLYRRRANGTVDHMDAGSGLPDSIITALLEDHDGRIWAGTNGGVCLWPRADAAAPLPSPEVFGTRQGLANNLVTTLLDTPEDAVWVGTSGGLSRIDAPETRAPGTPVRISRLTTAHGLPHPGITSLADDRYGHLWVGTDGGGAARVLRGGLTTFGEMDGLPDPHITSIFETRAGELCVTRAAGAGAVDCLLNDRFERVRPGFPAGTVFTWGWNQLVLQDRQAAWWFASGSGAWRFPAAVRAQELARLAPVQRIDARLGLPSNEVFRVFEDSRGDIWFGTLGNAAGATILARWDRRANRVVTYPGVYGTATSFREDHAGNVWIGFFTGGVARYRDGAFAAFGGADGVPAGMIVDLLVDQAGRLWVASYRGGLARVEHPESPRPEFVTLTTDDGLSSNSIRCLTEDRLGRVYAGTGRGVDRIDPRSSSRAGRLRHFTASDGLAGENRPLRSATRGATSGSAPCRDSRGTSPNPNPPLQPSPAVLTGLRVAGVDAVLSDVGERDYALEDLPPDRSRLEVTIASPGSSSGERVRYQWMLEGLDRDWSRPSAQRTVILAGLSAGRYRFLARTVSSEGVASGESAVLRFRVLSPVWKRWWFQACVLGLLGLAGYGIHRIRMARLLGLERVRTQIATDLHDEIGSGLARVAILSELVLRHASAESPAVTEPVGRMAALSRELGEAMGDIVWSVNPGKDHLSDLSHRMRRYAAELFDAQGISLDFHGPQPGVDSTLDPAVRRQVFLVFKESLTNALRHSGFTEARIRLGVEHGNLVYELRDNGRGFEPSAAQAGNGLPGMRRRAERVGGRLTIGSRPGEGVTVTLVRAALRTRPHARLQPYSNW